MHDNFPLNINAKEDSPKKVALLAGVDPKFFTSAVEINKILNALTELFDHQVILENTVGAASSGVVIIGNFLVWKKPGNADATILENGDYVEGWFSATLRIHADYTGGDIAQIASFTTYKEWDYS